jgi:glutathione S-transferase
MLTVHHLGLSQSERVVWLCEEVGVDYELKRYERRADNKLAPDDYKKLHPMGIAPVITDGDLVLGESAAICEYINIRYGGGRFTPGPSDPDFADSLFWFHWSNATYQATKMMGLVLSLSGGDPKKASFVQERTTRSLAMMEQRLADRSFFGGRQLTLADIMMVYSLTTSRAFGGGPAFPPVIRAYLQRIGERPAYQRAMAKAEPGMKPLLE